MSKERTPRNIKFEWTKIFWGALEEGFFGVAKVLIDKGLIKLNVIRRCGLWNTNTFLQEATHINNIKIVRFLLRNGADANIVDWAYEEGPIVKAINHQNVAMVKLLIKNGANVNLPDKHGTTPLFWAANNRNIKIIKLLLNAGADMNLPNNKEITPLKHAKMFKDNQEVVELLESFQKEEKTSASK